MYDLYGVIPGLHYIYNIVYIYIYLFIIIIVIIIIYYYYTYMYLQWWFKATPFIGDPQAMLGLLKGY
jgi:hypothetical protein